MTRLKPGLSISRIFLMWIDGSNDLAITRAYQGLHWQETGGKSRVRNAAQTLKFRRCPKMKSKFTTNARVHPGIRFGRQVSQLEV